jgi:dolichol-phosphate mannosyltransferase
MMARPVLSLVVPVRDEESSIPDLHTRILDLLGKVGQEAEVVFVNDGSKDLSSQVLRGLAAVEPRYRILSLSRPFGAAAAIAAGVAYARGQAVVALPSDLVERSDLVFEMAQKWRDGFDVVHLRARPRRGGLGGLVRRMARAMLPPDAPLEEGGARLMSRRAVVATRALGESHRFVRGVVAWIGFRQTEIEYDAEGFPPKLGATWRAAWSAIGAYSTVPLRLATYFGLVLGAFALFLGIVSSIVLAAGSTLPGWFAVAIIAALLASAELVAIGVLGDYVGKIYDEVKRRPLYVVSERINLFAPDDDIVDEAASPPPMIEVKPSAPPPAAATIMGMPAIGVSTASPATAPLPKTAPMAQVPPPPGFPPPPSSGATAAAAPAAGHISSSMKAAVRTAPVPTVKATNDPSTGGVPTVKPGTLEVPTAPQPSAEAPTIRARDDGATLESALQRPSTQSYPPPATRSSTPPPPPPAKTKPPPIPPKRAKKD